MSNDESGSTRRRGAKRNTRGPTWGKNIESLPNGQKINIKIDNHGQPCNKQTARLMTWIGVKAREAHLLPVTYISWKKIPRLLKDAAVDKIYEKFNLPENRKKWVATKLSKCWREFKHGLKVKVFKKYPTNEERLAHLDKRVPLEQWNVLLERWSQESTQVLSERNANHRGKLKSIHTTGTTSFAVIRERMRQEHPDEVPPSRMVLYKVTHSKEDGSPADPAAAETIVKMEEDLNEKPEEVRGDNTVQEKIFSTRVGEDTHGRVRMCGVGFTPKQKYGTATVRIKSYAHENDELQNELQIWKQIGVELTEEISGLQIVVAEKDEVICGLKADVAEKDEVIRGLKAELEMYRQFMEGQQK